MRHLNLIAASLVAMSTMASPALAEERIIEMLNRDADGQVMAFEPAFLQVASGDTVTFVSVDPGHNAETISGMVPEGGETFRGGMGQDVSVTLTAEGLYGVKCLPHYGMGMVALIQVGDGAASNHEEAAAVRQPGRANQRMSALFEQVAAAE